MTRIDRNSTNTQIYAYEIKQSVSKNFFLLLQRRRYDGIAHRLLSCYHSQLLLFSHSKNNFSTTLTPTDKPRYIYCRVFIIVSIYSTTIDIITNNILFFIFKQRTYV